MEEDKRTAPGLSKGEEQGGEVSAGEKAGDEDLPRGDASPGKEDASVANGGGHGDAEAEGDEEGDEVIFDSVRGAIIRMQEMLCS